jgi:hypothetical protein
MMEDFISSFKATAKNLSPDARTINTLDNYYISPEYPFKNYFILANTNKENISFCINSELPLPTDNFYITSHGTYHGKTI